MIHRIDKTRLRVIRIFVDDSLYATLALNNLYHLGFGEVQILSYIMVDLLKYIPGDRTQE